MIGRNIRRRRLELKMTATQLAARAGVSESAIRKIESGDSKQPSFEVGVRIAAALRVSPEALLPAAPTRDRATPGLARVLQLLRQRRTELDGLGVKGASVFGSVARGEDTESSDVDVLIDVAQTRITSLLDLSRIAVFLEDLFGRSVDVELRASLKKRQPLLLKAIEHDAVSAF